MLTPGDINNLPYRDSSSFTANDFTVGLKNTLAGMEVFKTRFSAVASVIGVQLPQGGVTGILVRNTCFVMLNGTVLGTPEKFDDPFNVIQTAIDRSGPNYSEWCIIIYPGIYTENIVIPAGLNLFFHPGVVLNGNITLGNNCHLQFESGSKIIGNITDLNAGVATDVVANICGCLTLQGVFELFGTNSYVTAEGEKFDGVNNDRGTLNLFFKELTNVAFGYITVYGGGVINIHGLIKTAAATPAELIWSSQGNINLYDCNISASQKALYGSGGDFYVENCNITASGNVIHLSSNATFRFNNSEFIGNGVLIDAGTSRFEGCTIRTNGASPAITTTGLGGGATVVLYNNYISSALAVPADMDAITIAVADFLTVNPGNVLIAKGVGLSVGAPGAVNIVTIDRSVSNANVAAGVTEAPGAIYQNAAVN